ncbi:hypothetical protein AAVH_42965 [Aphelenchoides avenae]|nr:hypothetical protein AAVH_42965 [Aphelenchus avenae]
MLVCPFCTVVFNVPANERNRAVSTAASYVQHVLDHDVEDNRQCSGCSTKFSEDAPRIMTEKLERHARAHAETIATTWTKRTKTFASLLEKPKNVVVEEGRGPKVCAECSEVVQDPQEHFGKLMKCDADGCHFETACKASFDKHEKLSDCRPQNRTRLGRANLFAPQTSLVEVLICTKDDFLTTDGGKMAKHSLKCGAEVIVSTVSSGSHIVGPKHSEGFDHIDEAKLFGPHKLPKPPTGPSSMAVDEKVLKLLEVIPAVMIKEALKTPEVVKAITTEVDASLAKETQMRWASSRRGIVRAFFEP